MLSGPMCTLCKAGCILVIIGAINWGLVGLGGFLNMELNLVYLLLGSWPMLEWLVYIVIGAAGVFGIFSSNCSCRHKTTA